MSPRWYRTVSKRCALCPRFPKATEHILVLYLCSSSLREPRIWAFMPQRLCLRLGWHNILCTRPDLWWRRRVVPCTFVCTIVLSTPRTRSTYWTRLVTLRSGISKQSSRHALNLGTHLLLAVSAIRTAGTRTIRVEGQGTLDRRILRNRLKCCE